MTLDDIVARCSRFSGFNLQWKMDDNQLIIWDPQDQTVGNQSRLVLAIDDLLLPREVYGRLRQWAISPAELEVMARKLRRENFVRKLATIPIEIPTDF